MACRRRLFVSSLISVSWFSSFLPVHQCQLRLPQPIPRFCVTAVYHRRVGVRSFASQSVQQGSIPLPSQTEDFKISIHRSPSWCSVKGAMCGVKYEIEVQYEVGVKYEILM